MQQGQTASNRQAGLNTPSKASLLKLNLCRDAPSNCPPATENSRVTERSVMLAVNVPVTQTCSQPSIFMLSVYIFFSEWSGQPVCTRHKLHGADVQLNMGPSVLPQVILDECGMGCPGCLRLSCRGGEQLGQPSGIPVPTQHPCIMR